MSLLLPAALALGLLAIPIILLYMLRLRRREHIVSSNFLWRELQRDTLANAPWQKLRRNILLFLQLLILASLVLSLARPFLRNAGPAGGNRIILLDASASMLATDGQSGTARFDEAILEAERLIDSLSGDDRLSIISVGRFPVVLSSPSQDRRLLRQALASAKAQNNAANWDAAISLAAASSQGLSTPQFIIISDGGLPEGLAALPGDVTFIPIGQTDENLAIASLSERTEDGRTEIFARLMNTGSTAANALLSLYVNDVLSDSRRVELIPEEPVNLTWTLPTGEGNIEARLEPTQGTADYLDIDNRAWLTSDHVGSRRVLLVSDGNLFLERFFSILPGYEVVKQSLLEGTSDFTTDNEGFDLYVFDGTPLPDTLPAGNILVIDPQPPQSESPPNPLIRVTGIFSDTTVTQLADDLLLADVDWRAVNVAEAQSVEAPGLTALVESAGGPLLLAGEINGRRAVILPFDLQRSDLPLQIAFPVVMANIIDWLSPGPSAATDESFVPGTVVPLLPPAQAKGVHVELPDGSERNYDLQDSGAPILFSTTSQPGIYSVFYSDRSGERIPAGSFAINFSDAAESKIQPSDSIAVGPVNVTSDNTGSSGRKELWPILLLAGLLLLLAEWWVAHRHRLPKSFHWRDAVK